MRILLVRPDVSVPLHVYIITVFGVIGGVGATISYLTGFRSMCELLPAFSMSGALVAALPWNLRRSRANFGGRRLAGLLVAFAVFTGVMAILCRSR